MTDVLDRRRDPVAIVDARPEPPRRIEFDPSSASRWMLAALSLGAGVIHFAMVPSHWNVSVREGVSFAAAGWFQVVVAAFVLKRPTRALLQVSILVNFALIGTWVVSRMFGLPVGHDAGVAEPATFVDVTCVGFEVALIVVSFFVLRRPRAGSKSAFTRIGMGAIVPIGVAVLTTAALASPSAANHATHGAAGHHHGTGDDKGLSLIHNGQHAHIAPQPLDKATQDKLDAQLAITRTVARQYPTVADVEAAGFTRVGPYFPGIGAHYLKFTGPGLNADGSESDEDLASPLVMIYDGTDPDSSVAGFMFYSQSSIEPEGFAGRNDVWHFHEDLCLDLSGGTIEAPYGLDHSATPEQCARAGGAIVPSTQYMLHVWSVPGWEVASADGGVFGEVNPKLDCADGTYYMLAVDEWASHKLNVCKSEAN